VTKKFFGHRLSFPA